MHANRMQCNIGDQGRLIDDLRFRQVVPGLGLKLLAVSTPELPGPERLPHSVAILERIGPVSHEYWTVEPFVL